MPHLQFELNFTPEREEKASFADAVRDHFASIMSTGTDHIGITFRCYQNDDLVFGRAGDEGQIAFLNADIRLGRTAEQKRRLLRPEGGQIVLPARGRILRLPALL